jgi:hypothetical protein
VVNSPADALDQGATDPVVAPPIYGRWHAGKSRVELSGGQIARSTTAAAPVPMRKVVRPRGAVIRKVERRRTGIIFAAALPPRGMVTVEGLSDVVFAAQPDVRAKVRSLGAKPKSIDPVAPQPGFVWVFTVQAEGGPLLPGHWERQRAGEPPGHRPTFLNFRAAATAREARTPRPGIIAIDARLNLGSLRGSILAQLNPAATITARVKARIQLTPASTIATAVTEDPLAPIMAAPDFPRPMYEALRDISSDYLLPGLEHVLPNTATMLQTNPAFVEAFLAGLSTEMARELLWREFPTDQRGTYFR